MNNRAWIVSEKVACPHRFSAFELGLLIACSALGVPPSPSGPPVGFEEWQRTRHLPKALFLTYVSFQLDDHMPAGVVISSPERVHLRRDPVRDGVPIGLEEPRFPGFLVTDSSMGSSHRYLHIGEDDQKSPNRSTFVRNGCAFDVGEKDVIPLYDQVYAVTLDPSGLVLSLVTDQVAPEFRPALDLK